MDMNVLQTLVGSVVNMTLRAISSVRGLWRSSNTPPTDNDYTGWVRPGPLVNEFLVNIGTQQDPQWVEMAPIQNIEENTIYPTTEKLFGKRVWAVRFNLGALPNNTTRTIQLPWQLTSIWGPPQERTIDWGTSYAYDVKGRILPLPYVDPANINRAILLELNNTNIVITSRQNYTAFFAIVTIKFTR